MPIRILLVDDDEAFRSVTAIALESEGCLVRETADARVALAALEQERPDLIICDLDMPGMDGRELCRRVRAAPELADLPIIVLSALIEPDGSGVATDAGADLFLSKQLPFSRLVSEISSLTGGIEPAVTDIPGSR